MPSTVGRYENEVVAGQRFEFGKNWARFLEGLTDERIAQAEASLIQMLGREALQGKSFLDIGSGSGLFSLAARRLGARVHSLDYDPYSVNCTAELRRRYFGDDPQWKVERGSALDEAYLQSLGKFDVVYSWGVLHHTGNMWSALENAGRSVADNGKLFVAIYNDQGTASKRWTKVKQMYNSLPSGLRFLVVWPAFWSLWWRRLTKDFLRLQPFHSIRHYDTGGRGMSFWRDHIDWVGGYPFEVAKPEQIFDFYFARGFHLLKLTTEGGSLGCNQFVFLKRSI